MAYIEFPQPGKYIIDAAIVWSNDDVKTLKKSLLKKETYNRYYSAVYQSNEFKPELVYGTKTINDSKTSIVVVMPKDFFAKESFDKKWVEYMFDYSAENQCQFRKRRLFAYPVQPILLGIWLPLTITIRTITAFVLGVLCGYRDIKYSAIMHPFKNDIDDVWYNRSNSVFIENAIGQDRPFVIKAMWPLPYVIIALIALMLKITPEITYSLIDIIKFTVFLFIGVVIFAGFFTLMNEIINAIKKPIKNIPVTTNKKLEEFYNQLADTTCDYFLNPNRY